MEQVFEGTPKAELKLEGRRIARGEVSQDWGSRLQWRILRDGKEIAVAPALRTERSYEHPDKTPGKYEVVLQMFKYVNYKKTKAGGEFVDSKYVDISNVVSYTV